MLEQPIVQQFVNENKFKLLFSKSAFRKIDRFISFCLKGCQRCNKSFVDFLVLLILQVPASAGTATNGREWRVDHRGPGPGKSFGKAFGQAIPAAPPCLFLHMALFSSSFWDHSTETSTT
jgi:hypothetical protein